MLKWRGDSQRPIHMRHFKIMGWSWILLGAFWSVIFFGSLFTSELSEPNVTISRFAWWENTISDILEGSIFVGSVICGLALLRRSRWSRPVTWILGGIWLFFSGLLIWGADGLLITRLIWLGPPLAIAVYSLVVLALAKWRFLRGNSASLP